MGASGPPLNASPAQVSGSDFVGIMTQHNYVGPARHLPVPVTKTATVRREDA